MDKKQLMAAIVAKVGRERAIELVAQAYNTELITTWIARIEANKPLGGPQRRDHLAGALEREQRALDLAQKQNPALESFIARARARIDDYRAGRAYLEYPQEPRD